MTKGMIFNVQRFSLHDGPGIRTTVFFKGCPLHCPWCHNPEGIDPGFSLFCYPSRCIGCGKCQEICPQEAVRLEEDGPRVDRRLCRSCLLCAESCPGEALQGAGREVEAAALIRELARDRIFFEESGGGVTLSGGEPLLQGEFLLELLAGLRDEGLSRVLQTSGWADGELLLQAGELVNLVLFDLKLPEDRESLAYTGRLAGPIVENLQRLTASGSPTVVRIPLVPGVNDGEKDLSRLVHILHAARVAAVELLDYHAYGEGKYAALGLGCRSFRSEEPAGKLRARAAAHFTAAGIKVTGQH